MLLVNFIPTRIAAALRGFLAAVGLSFCCRYRTNTLVASYPAGVVWSSLAGCRIGPLSVICWSSQTTRGSNKDIIRVVVATCNMKAKCRTSVGYMCDTI